MPSLVPLLWDTLLKGAAILLLVGLGTNLLRRSAASTRYHIWILALVAVFFLPLMTVLVPDTTLTVIRKYPLSTPMVTEPPRAAPPSIRPLNPLPSPSEVVPPQAPPARTKVRVNEGRLRQHAPVLSVGAWLAGAVLIAVWQLLRVLGVAWMARSARPVSDPEWTTIATRAAKSQKLERAPSLLVSARVPVPLVWGLLRPVVVLPEDAAVWPPERLEVVLHRELAHVKRWDHLTVLLEHLMSTLHWINPLVWIAVAKLEREREQACDDAVLRAGVRASEYARQLLAIANPYGRQARMLGDLAMARTSVIEERLRAILDPERNRGTTTFLSRVATGAVLLCMTLPIASVWIWASSPPTELSAAVFQTAAALQGKSSLILEGAVQDAEGNPGEGAVVVVPPTEGSFGDGPVTVRTDRNGRFSMSLIHSATYTVRVVAEGYVPWVEKRAGPGKALEVTLYRGFTLQGIVMDGHNRNPLAGARVEAKPDDLTILPSMPRLGIVETETDGEGRFQLSGLGEGFYTVSARAKGYGRTEQTVVRPGESLELFLFPGSLLIGTVRDEEDRPIEGAFIQLFSDKPLSSGYLIVSERSDPNGKFEILGTPPGTYQMAVRHRQRAPVVVPDIEVGRDEEVELDIRLIRGANVVGRLVDFDGVPISGVAAVEILDGHSVPPLLSDLRCRSGENGYFELPLLPPGAHVIRIDARGYVPRQLDVDIGDRQEPIDLGDIDLDSGLSIGGRVTDEDGRPIVGARVLASGSGRRGRAPTFEALSGEDGDFLLGGLSEGSYWVSAVREGYAGKKAAPVRAGTENLNLVLEPGGSISGVVVDDQDNPMRAFRVSVGAVGRGARPYESVAHLQGRFTVKDLSPDTYVLEVVVPDHVPATVSDIEVEAGAETNVGDVRVSRGCRIQGYVVNTTGTALPGAVVRVSMPWTMLRKSGRYQTVTNREGFFSLTGVPEITDGLVARHPDYAEGRVGMLRVGTSKEPVEVRIVLSRGGSVEGWVRGRHGLGIEGRVVLAYSRRMGAQPSFDRDMTTTDSNGYFFLENLSAGPTRVQVYRRSGGVSQGVQGMNVTIREGETVQVEFVSRPVHLQGRVTRGGVPVPGLALVFVSLDAGGGQFGPFAPLTPEVELELMRDVTSEDGYYELLLDQPGRYFVSTESEHDSSFDTSRLVEVPDADVHIFDVDLGGTAVVGKVIDEQTGEPVSRAFIHARPTEGDLMTRSSYAVNRSDGRFELVLNPGRYILGIRADGYLSQELELDVDGAGPAEVTIGMKLDRLIRGRVVDEMGRGTANVFVSACTENASMEARGAGRTKADGSFEIGGLTGLSYNVLAVMEERGFAFASHVMPGSPEVTLILQPGGWVVFVVRDMYGNPIEDAFVALSAISGSPVLGFAGGRTDAAGRVVVLLPSGHVEITIRKNEVESKIALDVPRGGTIPVEAVLR